MNKMHYDWKRYSPGDAGLVDTWLDDAAIRETGLEDGWQNFYDYWMAESRTGKGKDRCFLLSREGIPFAVMYLAVLDGEVTISEFVVAPDMRGKGHGTAALKEFLDRAAELLGPGPCLAKAVIYPTNRASRKTFEKAGFVQVSEQHDDFGDSLHYQYRFL